MPCSRSRKRRAPADGDVRPIISNTNHQNYSTIIGADLVGESEVAYYRILTSSFIMKVRVSRMNLL